MSSYYWKSEIMCASFALRELEKKLSEGTPEWGTTIFCWEDKDSLGQRYSYQPIYTTGESHHWRPIGKLPSFAKECAICHSHPSTSFFSSTDLKTARGESGLVRFKRNMYMVNQIGAYRYLTLPEEVADVLTRDQRFTKLWGEWPKKEN